MRAALAHICRFQHPSVCFIGAPEYIRYDPGIARSVPRNAIVCGQRRMAALDEDVFRTELVHEFGEGDDVGQAFNLRRVCDAGVLEEEQGFGDVGCEEGSLREDLAEEVGDGLGGEELGARGGEHDLG